MRIRFLFVLLAMLVGNIATAAKVGPSPWPQTRELPAGEGPWVVRARFTSDQSLTRLLERAAPWRVDRDAGQLIIEVNNRAEYQQLLDEGFRVAVDPELTAEAFGPVAQTPDQIESISGYPCFRTVEESLASAQAVVAQHGAIAELVDIGDSWKKQQNAAQGYDLWVLRLTNRSIPGIKPVHYLQGGLHAREYVTSETVLRYGEWLAAQYDVNPDVTWILDHQEVHILFHANPDGRKVAEVSTTRLQRKNRNENFCPTGSTTLGVDNNRNFPFDWGGPGSSGTACNETFRGPSAASEPESQAIIAYLRQIFPDQRNEGPGVDLVTPVSNDATGIYMDVHSNAGTTWWPWGNVNGVFAPNRFELQTLGRKIAYYNGLTPEQSNAGGAIGGATDDFTYGTLGVAAFTIEMDGSSFWPSCTSYENTLVQPTLDGFFMASKLARAPYRWAAGPEIINVLATPAQISLGGTVTISARAEDARFNNTVGTEPSQTVTGAAIYATPPWQAGGTPLAQFQPGDGAFNSAAENITVDLPASSLSPGRQLLYLRATDALGNAGPVAAVFVTVGQPDPLFQNGFE
ncbi:MAG: M14 family zinc carboxypeptidase [Lysobacterales bacterium]